MHSPAEVGVEVLVREGCSDLGLPGYQSPGAAGADLRAAVTESISIAPGERVRVPTGISIAVPSGFEAQVRPRSGRAIKDGLTLVNSPGTIDSDFRGEIQALMINLGNRPVWIERGDRIAQLVVAPVVRAVFRPVEALSSTERGTRGFGSTGEK